MFHYIKMFAVTGMLVSAAAAQMQPVVSGEEGSGSVDWSKRVIVVTGIGAPNPDLTAAQNRPGTLRAAKLIAIRNALETVKGIYLNSSTTIQNFMTSSDVITTSVNGYVKGFEQKGRDKYMSDGTAEVTLEIPLDGIGNFADIVLGEKLSDKPSVTIFEGKKSKEEHIFTGLIIDCRGLSVKPALSPRVLDSEGREIYGSAYVTKEWAVKYGITGYSKDVAAAAKLDRVGSRPGQVKAVKVSGENKTDIVLSESDAADIRSAAKNLKFLSECRVILVVD
jgi:hypothetical protein